MDLTAEKQPVLTFGKSGSEDINIATILQLQPTTKLFGLQREVANGHIAAINAAQRPPELLLIHR